METRTRPRCGLGQAAYPFGVQGEFMLGAEIVQWVLLERNGTPVRVIYRSAELFGIRASLVRN
jgi:hypothetical protein